MRGRTLLVVAVVAGCARTEPGAAAPTAPRVISVVAVQDGRVVIEEYFGGADAATLHDPRSAMKTVTALAVGVAIERRLIQSVDEPAFAFLADRAPFAHDGPRKRGITIADLLVLARGAWQGRQVVPAAWIDAMTSRTRCRGSRAGERRVRAPSSSCAGRSGSPACRGG